jgi:LysR family transcriptional regulator, hypochlorite-specific transcription factor HypT
MEIRWLEDFIALAKTRHFSRAADEQNVTQPTFSRRIKLLEEEMKVTLVDRNTLPLSLTSAGEVFLQSAEMITRELRETKVRCLEIKDQSLSQVRLIATQELFLGFFRQSLLPVCQQLAIDIDVNMKSSTWSETDFISSMMRQESDLLLCFWHPGMNSLNDLEQENFDYIVLGRETLVPCSATNGQGHALFELPGTKKLPLPYISYDETSFLASAIQYHLQRQHDIAQLNFLTSDMNAVGVAAMVKEGYGLGWLPEQMIRKSLDQTTLVLSGDKRWEIPLQIRLYKSHDNQNPYLMSLWQHSSQSNF